MPESGKCLNCSREFKGRADKKFCSDQCRNDYNNQEKMLANNHYVRNVNKALKNNRKIMEQLMQSGKEVVKVPLAKLNTLGFKFKYLTHTYTTKKGTVYHYVYEYGYLALENNWYLLVKDEKKAPVPEKTPKELL